MDRLTLNSVSLSSLRVSASEVVGGTNKRADLVSKGRMLYFEHAAKGKGAMNKAMGLPETNLRHLTGVQYNQLNEKFQNELLLYCAEMVSATSGVAAPSNIAEFRRMAQNYYNNAQFYLVLSGVFQEVINPILPAVYSEAVSTFADVVEVNFGETYAVTIGSNDIPFFQDSSWGASRSVPRNRFYSKTYTLNPSPKSAWITAKYMQLIGTGMDFGAFFANIAAGLYAKTMGMWNEALSSIVTGSMIPSGLTFTFDNTNWVTAANKVAAVNNTVISNVFATGGAVALSKVLPTEVTGSTNVNMDAAIATMLGADYVRAGYLGQFMSVRLMPLQDVVIPGTQNGNVSTMLSANDVWMMAGNGRKPITIAMNRDVPIQIEMNPTKTADFEIGINLTTALDAVATIPSKIAHITV